MLLEKDCAAVNLMQSGAWVVTFCAILYHPHLCGWLVFPYLFSLTFCLYFFLLASLLPEIVEQSW
jgi:hypothetical protein